MSEWLTNIQQQQNAMEQTTARLRKTFHYLAHNDSEDSLPEALDEEGTFLSPPFLQNHSASRHPSIYLPTNQAN